MNNKYYFFSFLIVGASIKTTSDWLNTNNLLKKLDTVREELANDINVFSGIQGNLNKLSNSLETMNDIRVKAFNDAKKCIDTSRDYVNSCEENYTNISVTGSIEIAKLNQTISKTIDDKIQNKKRITAEITTTNREIQDKEVTTATLINLTEETANQVVEQLGLIRNDYQKLVTVRTPAITAIDDLSKELKIYLGALSETLDNNANEYCDKTKAQDQEEENVNDAPVCECQK